MCETSTRDREPVPVSSPPWWIAPPSPERLSSSSERALLRPLTTNVLSVVKTAPPSPTVLLPISLVRLSSSRPEPTGQVTGQMPSSGPALKMPPP